MACFIESVKFRKITICGFLVQSQTGEVKVDAELLGDLLDVLVLQGGGELPEVVGGAGQGLLATVNLPQGEAI